MWKEQGKNHKNLHEFLSKPKNKHEGYILSACLVDECQSDFSPFTSHREKRNFFYYEHLFKYLCNDATPPLFLFDFSKYNARLNIIKQPNYYANNCLFHLTYRRIHGERTIRRRFVKTKQKGPAEINRKAIHKDVQPFVNHLIKKEAGGRRKHIEDRRWFEFGYIDI